MHIYIYILYVPIESRGVSMSFSLHPWISEPHGGLASLGVGRVSDGSFGLKFGTSTWSLDVIAVDHHGHGHLMTTDPWWYKTQAPRIWTSIRFSETRITKNGSMRSQFVIYNNDVPMCLSNADDKHSRDSKDDQTSDPEEIGYFGPLLGWENSNLPQRGRLYGKPGDFFKGWWPKSAKWGSSSFDFWAEAVAKLRFHSSWQKSRDFDKVFWIKIWSAPFLGGVVFALFCDVCLMYEGQVNLLLSDDFRSYSPPKLTCHIGWKTIPCFWPHFWSRTWVLLERCALLWWYDPYRFS